MPVSRAEVRAAHATIEGAKTGMSRKYAREVIKKMHGRKMSSLPERQAKGKKYYDKARANRAKRKERK